MFYFSEHDEKTIKKTRSREITRPNGNIDLPLDITPIYTNKIVDDLRGSSLNASFNNLPETSKFNQTMNNSKKRTNMAGKNQVRLRDALLVNSKIQNASSSPSFENNNKNIFVHRPSG